MKLLNAATGKVLTRADLGAAYPNVAFPEVITSESVAALGLIVVAETPPPPCDNRREYAEATVVFNGSTAAEVWSIKKRDQAVVDAMEQDAARALSVTRAMEIDAELSAIDARSIRSLREGNIQRIVELEAQAEALRIERKALQQ